MTAKTLRKVHAALVDAGITERILRLSKGVYQTTWTRLIIPTGYVYPVDGQSGAKSTGSNYPIHEDKNISTKENLSNTNSDSLRSSIPESSTVLSANGGSGEDSNKRKFLSPDNEATREMRLLIQRDNCFELWDDFITSRQSELQEFGFKPYAVHPPSTVKKQFENFANACLEYQGRFTPIQCLRFILEGTPWGESAEWADGPVLPIAGVMQPAHP